MEIYAQVKMLDYDLERGKQPYQGNSKSFIKRF